MKPTARSSRARRSRSRAQRRLARIAGYVRVGALGLLLCAMVVGFVVVLALRGSEQGGVASACDPARVTLCAANQPRWVAMRAAAPDAVLSAARTVALYQQVAADAQSALGSAIRAGSLGSPVLVRVYRPAPGTTDVWVIPVLAPAGTPLIAGAPPVVALLTFAYDQAHLRMRPLTFSGPFVPTDPEYGQPFPLISADAALAKLQAARGLAPAAGARPQLVYFPADLGRMNDSRSPLRWTGGGQFPELAIWLVPASDGHDYLIGRDGLIYTPADLPLSANAVRS